MPPICPVRPAALGGGPRGSGPPSSPVRLKGGGARGGRTALPARGAERGPGTRGCILPSACKRDNPGVEIGSE
jgi:hypothetical protein